MILNCEYVSNITTIIPITQKKDVKLTYYRTKLAFSRRI